MLSRRVLIIEDDADAAGVGVDDWGPEYPFIEEDEESDDANS